jgi:hypothetical protein
MTFLDNVVARWRDWRARRQQEHALLDVVEQLKARDRESALRDRLRRELRDEIRDRRTQERNGRPRW